MNMIPKGFAPWVMFYAPPDAAHPTDFPKVRIWREGWGEKTEIVEPNKLGPAFNVYGLYWRPVEPEEVGK